MNLIGLIFQIHNQYYSYRSNPITKNVEHSLNKIGGWDIINERPKHDRAVLDEARSIMNYRYPLGLPQDENLNLLKRSEKFRNTIPSNQLRNTPLDPNYQISRIDQAIEIEREKAENNWAILKQDPTNIKNRNIFRESMRRLSVLEESMDILNEGKTPPRLTSANRQVWNQPQDALYRYITSSYLDPGDSVLVLADNLTENGISQVKKIMKPRIGEKGLSSVFRSNDFRWTKQNVGQADVVILDGLEKLHNNDKVLEKILTLLKEDGKIIVTAGLDRSPNDNFQADQLLTYDKELLKERLLEGNFELDEDQLQGSVLTGIGIEFGLLDQLPIQHPHEGAQLLAVAKPTLSGLELKREQKPSDLKSIKENLIGVIESKSYENVASYLRPLEAEGWTCCRIAHPRETYNRKALESNVIVSIDDAWNHIQRNLGQARNPTNLKLESEAFKSMYGELSRDPKNTLYIFARRKNPENPNSSEIELETYVLPNKSMIGPEDEKINFNEEWMKNFRETADVVMPQILFAMHRGRTWEVPQDELSVATLKFDDFFEQLIPQWFDDETAQSSPSMSARAEAVKFSLNLSPPQLQYMARTQPKYIGGSGTPLLIVPRRDGTFAVIKVARGVSRKGQDPVNKLMNEASFITTTLGAYETIQEKSPKIHYQNWSGGSPDSNGYYYLMEEIKGDNLPRRLWDANIHPSHVFKSWKEIFSLFLDQSSSTQQAAPNDWAMNAGQKKTHDRLAELVDRFSTFKSLSRNKTITIDGKKYLNLPRILERINILNQLDSENILNPDNLMLTHNDLNLANLILTEEGDVYFVDPRGDLLGDPVYDVAKGIHDMEFFLTDWNALATKSSSRDDEGRQSFDLYLRTPKRFPQEKVKNVTRGYSEFLEEVNKNMFQNGEDYEDKLGKHWKLRLFYHYSHLWASMPIFYARRSVAKKNEADEIAVPERVRTRHDRELILKKQMLEQESRQLIITAVTRYLLGVVYLNRFARLYANELEKMGIEGPAETVKNIPTGETFNLNEPITNQLVANTKARDKRWLTESYELAESKSPLAPFLLATPLYISVLINLFVQFEVIPVFITAVSVLLQVFNVWFLYLIFSHLYIMIIGRKYRDISKHNFDILIGSSDLKYILPHDFDFSIVKIGRNFKPFQISYHKNGMIYVRPEYLSNIKFLSRVIRHEWHHINHPKTGPPNNIFLLIGFSILKYTGLLFFYREITATLAELKKEKSKKLIDFELSIEKRDPPTQRIDPESNNQLTSYDNYLTNSNALLEKLRNQNLLDHSKLADAEDFAAFGEKKPIFVESNSDKIVRFPDVPYIFIPTQYIRVDTPNALRFQPEEFLPNFLSSDEEVDSINIRHMNSVEGNYDPSINNTNEIEINNIARKLNDERDAHYLKILNKKLNNPEYHRRFFKYRKFDFLFGLGIKNFFILLYKWVRHKDHPSRHFKHILQIWYDQSHGIGKWKYLPIKKRHKASVKFRRAIAFSSLIPDVIDPKNKSTEDSQRLKPLLIPHVHDLFGKKNFELTDGVHEPESVDPAVPYEAFPVDGNGNVLTRRRVRKVIREETKNHDRARYSGEVITRILTGGMTRRLKWHVPASLMTPRDIAKRLYEAGLIDVEKLQTSFTIFDKLPNIGRQVLQDLATIIEIADRNNWDVKKGLLNQKFIIPLNSIHEKKVLEYFTFKSQFFGLPPQNFYFIVQQAAPGFSLIDGNLVQTQIDEDYPNRNLPIGTRGNGDLFHRHNQPFAVFTLDEKGRKVFRRTPANELFRTQGRIYKHHQISMNHALDPSYNRDPSTVILGLAAKKLGLLGANQLRRDQTGIKGAGVARLDEVHPDVQEFFQTDQERMTVMLETVLLGSNDGFPPGLRIKEKFYGVTFAAILVQDPAKLQGLQYFTPSATARGIKQKFKGNEYEINVNVDLDTWGYGDLNVQDSLHFDPGYWRDETKREKDLPEALRWMGWQDNQRVNPNFYKLIQGQHGHTLNLPGLIPTITTQLFPLTFNFLSKFRLDHKTIWQFYRWALGPSREELVYSGLYVSLLYPLSLLDLDLISSLFIQSIILVALRAHHVSRHTQNLKKGAKLIGFGIILSQVSLSLFGINNITFVFSLNVFIHSAVNILSDIGKSDEEHLSESLAAAIHFLSTQRENLEPEKAEKILKGLLLGSNLLLDVNSIDGQINKAMNLIESEHIDQNKFRSYFINAMGKHFGREINEDHSWDYLLSLGSFLSGIQQKTSNKIHSEERAGHSVVLADNKLRNKLSGIINSQSKNSILIIADSLDVEQEAKLVKKQLRSRDIHIVYAPKIFEQHDDSKNYSLEWISFNNLLRQHKWHEKIMNSGSSTIIASNRMRGIINQTTIDEVSHLLIKIIGKNLKDKTEISIRHYNSVFKFYRMIWEKA